MTRLTKLLLWLTTLTYFGFFLVEAVLWPLQWVQALLLPQLNPTLTYDLAMQAATLRSLFLNQGAYNLLMGLGGVWALQAWDAGKDTSALAILRFLCLFPIGAAMTLLATTHAYALGILQLVFPIAALWSLRQSNSHRPHRAD